MAQQTNDYQQQRRMWELLRAFRSLDARQQQHVLAFVLALESGTAMLDQ